jgi:plasmid stability protein
VDTIEVSLWLEFDIPTNLTLKNIPDSVNDRLKRSSEANRRSMNSEAIVCLEAVFLPAKGTLGERLARAQELRAALPKGQFKVRDIDEMKRAGRP